MRIKERFEKQNNSIKQLMKKLRRHDTIVVAIAVLIALVLCGGLIYLSTPVVASTTIEEYEENNKASNEQTKEKLNEIKDYLTELDKLVCENKEGIDSIYEKTNELKEINNNEVNNNEVNTAKESSLIKSTITEKMIGLDKSVTEIHTSIEKTNEKISEMEKLIISGNDDNKKEIADGFAGINEQLSIIKEQYVQIQEKNLSLSEELKKAVNDGDKQINSNLNDRYNEMIAKLAQMNENMETKSKETIEVFKADIQSLGADIDGKLANLGTTVDNNFISLNGTVDSGFQGVNNNLNNKVSELSGSMESLGTNMDSKFDNLEKNVNDYNETVVTKIDSQNEKMDSDISGLRALFEEQMSSVNSRIDQVFQYVSNGKRQLASALLTKGITVSPDASFSELSEAISKIETDVPAEIELIRHYHVDGNGNELHAEEAPSDRKGGCFNDPKGHTHDKKLCYKKVTEYTYITGQGVENRGIAYTVNDEIFYNYYCSYCRGSFAGSNPLHKEYTRDYSVIAQREGTLDATNEVSELDCPYKNQSQVYGANCGYSDGQIIDAKIKDKNKNENAGENTGSLSDINGNTYGTTSDYASFIDNSANADTTDFSGEGDSSDNNEEKPEDNSREESATGAASLIEQEASGEGDSRDGGALPQP